MWRVMLVAELHPGMTTETELACIERDEEVGLADLGLRLDEVKRLTAALQAEMVPAQMAALGECPRGRGSDPGYTRNVESLGWRGSGRFRCNP
jgi:hypothetical protein